MMSPCKDCPDKGCGIRHADCERYLAFKAECEGERRERQLNAKCNFYHKKMPRKHRTRAYSAYEE